MSYNQSQVLSLSTNRAWTVLGQKKFVITKVDCFTKWLEVEATSTITKAQVENFVWNNIISWFGILHTFFMDNGKQFDNLKFRDFCEGLAITPRFLFVAHP